MQVLREIMGVLVGFGKKFKGKKLKLLLSVFAVLSLLFVSFSDAFAKKRKKRRKVIRVGEIVIRQRVIKPQAMIILNRSATSLIKADLSVSQNFSREILKEVNPEELR